MRASRGEGRPKPLDTDCDPTDMDIVIPGNDDALKSARLMVEQLVGAVEEGSANHREALASAEVAEHHEDEETFEGDPRPTRAIRPIPEMASSSDGEAAPEAAAEGGDDTATAVAEPPAAEETHWLFAKVLVLTSRCEALLCWFPAAASWGVT